MVLCESHSNVNAFQCCYGLERFPSRQSRPYTGLTWLFCGKIALCDNTAVTIPLPACDYFQKSDRTWMLIHIIETEILSFTWIYAIPLQQEDCPTILNNLISLIQHRLTIRKEKQASSSPNSTKAHQELHVFEPSHHPFNWIYLQGSHLHRCCTGQDQLEMENCFDCQGKILALLFLDQMTLFENITEESIFTIFQSTPMPEHLGFCHNIFIALTRHWAVLLHS